MFLDTITALQSANDYGRNALEVLDQEVGWHRLLRMKPELESMVEDNEAWPLTLATEQYATVNKYAGQIRCVSVATHFLIPKHPLSKMSLTRQLHL